jgi:hypothetical protein
MAQAQIGYLQVMEMLGALTGRHPSIVSLVMQTINLWKPHQDEAVKIYSEYLTASAKATSTMDTAGIVLELLALHPTFTPLLTHTLTMWQSHIVELCEAITETQSAATNAAKGG